MTSLDFLTSLPLPAQISVGVFGGWLLIEAVKLADRFIVCAHAGLIRPKTIAGIYALLVLVILAVGFGYRANDPDERFSTFGVSAIGVVGILLTMRLHTRQHSSVSIIVPSRSRSSSPIEATSTADAAPTSIDDDWSDIAQQVREENRNA